MQAELTRLPLGASCAEKASVVAGAEEGGDITERCAFGPWCAAPAPGTPTFGLTSSTVSRSDQRRVPGDISVEGIALTLKGVLPVKVFVLSQKGKPLMSTTPRRARLWLKAKRARVVRQEPFTIQLRFLTTEYTQPAMVGVDTGSREVEVAATTNGNVVFQAEVHLRTDIAQKMRQRGQYRRNRRGRKTRYHAPRFANRRRPQGDVGYIAGRREKGAFVINDITSGKKLLEVTPRKLVRVARPTRGWMITRLPALDSMRKEGGASFPS